MQHIAIMSEKYTGIYIQPGTVIWVCFVLFYLSNINNNKMRLVNHFHTSIGWESQCEAHKNVHFCFDHVFVEVMHLSYFRYSTCHPFTWYVQLVPHPLSSQGEFVCVCGHVPHSLSLCVYVACFQFSVSVPLAC